VFCEVFGEVGRFFTCSECILLFLELCGKAVASLSHIRLTMSPCILIVSVYPKSVAYALTIFV